VTRSIRTRLVLAIAALVAGVAIAAIGGVYWATVAALDRGTSASVGEEIGGLTEHWRRGGLDALVREVERRSREEPGGFGYLVARERTTRIAGNIRQWPEGHSAEGPGEALPVEVRQADVWLLKQLHVESVALGDHQLLVGRDISERAALMGALRWAAVAGLGLAGLLAIASGLAVGRGLLDRVVTMRARIADILGGARGERVPVGSRGDEFDDLAVHFNRLLDENERLLAQVREATNNIAHDLRTPLQRMHARLEGALSTAPATGESRAVLEALSADADRLLDTFNGLLQIAQVEAAELRKEMQPTAIGPLVDDLRDLYEPLAEEVGLALEIDVEPDLVVRAERQLLGQALANLVDNAIKYAANGRSIEISARRKGARIVVSVGDHGPGIAEADRERVLERLVRLDRSRSLPGSGLGLSFVAAVARLHGCELVLEDNHPGLRVALIFGDEPSSDPANAARP
jgi:signal transduction histidine kinase